MLSFINNKKTNSALYFSIEYNSNLATQPL